MNNIWTKEQRVDPSCTPLPYYLESSDDTHLPHLLVPRPEFDIRDETLVRTTYLVAKYEPEREVTQIVVPKTLVSTIIGSFHSAPQAGHPRKDRCLHQARLEHYWPTMHKDINTYTDVYHTCAINKGSVSKTVPILSYPSPIEPWDTLAIDLLKLPMTIDGHQHLLVATDHFSRYSTPIPLKNETAQTVATALIDKVFCKFNNPKVLLSDNGTEFNNSILTEICNQSIRKTNIMVYHLATNNMAECQNRKILSHLHTLVRNIRSFWHEWMPQVAASLNSSLHTSRGKTPHFVVFGKDKHLPYSVLIQKGEPVYNFDGYVRVRAAVFVVFGKDKHLPYSVLI